jgi:glycosyltransferase involved in cell wall biosynthesis
LRLSLTVVIPALNEERRLPSLLAKLASQTRQPQQIIVADAHSTDRTRQIAEQAGALVVDGGRPAAGRNAGAAVATTDLLLFLDADVDPDPEWIQRAVAEFVDRGLVVAGTTIEPIESDAMTVFSCDVVNSYLQLMQYVQPHAPGFCILVRRQVHERIGGFDESLALAEDHDYVQRAAGEGKFRILRNAPMRTSMRRVDKEGLVRMAFIIVYTELFMLSGLPIKRIPFEYEFGSFETAGVSRRRIRRLQEALGRIAEPAVTLSSDGWSHLSAVLEAEGNGEGLKRALSELSSSELVELSRYVLARARAGARIPPIMMRRAVKSARKPKHKMRDAERGLS